MASKEGCLISLDKKAETYTVDKGSNRGDSPCGSQSNSIEWNFHLLSLIFSPGILETPYKNHPLWVFLLPSKKFTVRRFQNSSCFWCLTSLPPIVLWDSLLFPWASSALNEGKLLWRKLAYDYGISELFNEDDSCLLLFFLVQKVSTCEWARGLQELKF